MRVEWIPFAGQPHANYQVPSSEAVACRQTHPCRATNSFQLHAQKVYAPNIKPMGPIALRIRQSGSIPYDSLPFACMYGGTVASQLPLSIGEERAHEAGQVVHRLAAHRFC